MRPQIESKIVKVEIKNLQVGMKGMLEAESNEIEQLRHDLQEAQVRAHNT